MEKILKISLAGTLVLAVLISVHGQDDPPSEGGSGVLMSTAPKLSQVLAETLASLPQEHEVTREQRQEAYAKLLEGQRYLWNIKRLRSSSPGMTLGARMAEQALKRAVELDPKLAEGYTALAELALTAPPQDIEEAIGFSKIATRLDSDNFGGHKFLGRLYTIKSNIGRGRLNPGFAEDAISSWKEIGRLDPLNAEAWAFLSALYKETDRPEERIAALKSWLASARPIDDGFYNHVMRSDSQLSPESASIKLGEALLESGRYEEALEFLTRAISDDPQNLEAVELLSQALENADPDSTAAVTGALRQAVYANPEDLTLNQLLAQTLAGEGRFEEAEKVLVSAAEKVRLRDARLSSGFYAALGDLNADNDRPEFAVAGYRKALEVRKIDRSRIRNGSEREFASLIYSRMISTLKSSERYPEAEAVIDEASKLFGEDDITPDKERIDLRREKGDHQSALSLVRELRTKHPDDYSLLRSEAAILTDLGRVKEGVGLVEKLIDGKPEGGSPSVMYDDYINHLFISSLYNQAGDSESAISAAMDAYSKALGEERRQIAKMTLASAQQSAGDYKSAEKNLNEILERSPSNPIALNNLGYLYLESGKNFERALELIKAAIRIDGKNPSYLDSLGWAYFKLGKFDKAESYLRRALRYDRTSATILEHLGDVLKARGDEEGAGKVWRKALRFSASEADSERIGAKLEM